MTTAIRQPDAIERSKRIIACIQAAERRLKELHECKKQVITALDYDLYHLRRQENARYRDWNLAEITAELRSCGVPASLVEETLYDKYCNPFANTDPPTPPKNDGLVKRWSGDYFHCKCCRLLGSEWFMKEHYCQRNGGIRVVKGKEFQNDHRA